jgi:hypothetical protein
MRRRGLLIVVLALAVLPTAPSGAQPARVGRLPVLSLPSRDDRRCAHLPITRQLDRMGIARAVNLNDSATHHFVSLSIDRSGQPKLLLAMMSTDEGRRHESEGVTVGFDVYGRILTGRRTAMTGGTPARTSEDSRVPLLAGDTAEIDALVKGVRRLCRI